MIPISFVEVLQIVWDCDKLPTPWSGWKENDDQIERAYRKKCERFHVIPEKGISWP
jgi:hypothetical protein